MNLPNASVLSVALLAFAAAIASTGCRNAPGKPSPGTEVARPDEVVEFATLYDRIALHAMAQTVRMGRQSRLLLPSTSRSPVSPIYSASPRTAFPAQRCPRSANQRGAC